MNVNLDLLSLLLTSATFNTVMIGVMIYIWKFRRTYAGFGYWILAVLSNVIGQVSLAFLETKEFSLLAACGASFVVGMPIFGWYGLRLFMNIKTDPRQLVAILMTTFLLLSAATAVSDSLDPRRFIISLIGLIFCLLALTDIRRHLNKFINGGFGLLQLGLILASALLMIRLVSISGVMLTPAPNAQAGAAVNEYSILILTSLRLIFVFAFLMLTQQRLELELIEAKHQVADNAKKFTDQLRGLNAVLLESSRRDALTDLANRRYFDEKLDLEWRRHIRTDAPLALMLIDVDHFKLFNDTYGHSAGDECLRSVARILTEIAARPGDFAARYGGEEFAIILTDTDANGAVKIAEDLVEKIASLQYPFSESPTSAVVSVSIGIDATIPSADQDPGMLIERADRALYWAKDNGRKQFKLWEPGIER